MLSVSILKQLDFSDADKLLRKYKIKTPPFGIAKTPHDAVKIARKIGYPVVMKIISPDILHKTERKGVIVGLKSDSEVEKSFEEIRKHAGKAKFKGMLIQKQVEGKETIIGGKKDPQFGAVVLFGLGGIFVEVMKDVSLRIAPIDKREAMEMIKEVKGYPILAGIRGQKPVNLEKLAEMIASVSRMLSENDIQELDLNPVLVNDKECLPVDVRMMK
jgi:acetyl-CoA synthetase (ADP-forming)